MSNERIVTLQKSYNKYIVFFLLGILASIFVLIFMGGAFSEGIIWLGVLLAAVTAMLFGGTLALMLVKRKKYLPLILAETEKELLGTLEERKRERSFKTNDGRRLEFAFGGLTLGGKRYEKEQLSLVYSFSIKSHMIHDDLSLTLSVAADTEAVHIPLNGDVIDALKENGLSAINEEDFEYFLNNSQKETKRLLKAAFFTAVTAQPAYYPLVFTKNEQEKKQAKKQNAASWGKIVLMFLVWLTVMAAVAWIANSEEGAKLLNPIRIIVLIAYTVAFFLCAFVKANDVSLYQKIALCAYPLAFWLGIIFLDRRMAALVDIVFLSVFILFVALDIRKKGMDKDPSFRLFLPVFGIMLFGAFTLTTTNFLDGGNEAALTGAIVAGVLLLFSVCWAVWYIAHKKQTETYQKKKDLTQAIVLPLSLLFVGFFFGFYYSSAFNYIFDTSEPIACSEEIIEVRKSDDGDYATVVFRGEELDLPLSGEERFSCEVGDMIEFALYKGAFGWEYVMR